MLHILNATKALELLMRILVFFFSGAFAKLRKTTISFVLSVRPRVRMEQHGFHWTDFHEI
jgi:hypothetical protein